MNLTLKLFAGIVGGFATHFFHKPTAAFGPKWGTLVRYAIGYLAALPFMLMLLPEECREKVISAYLLTAGSFGTGVFIGYITDDSE